MDSTQEEQKVKQVDENELKLIEKRKKKAETMRRYRDKLMQNNPELLKERNRNNAKKHYYKLKAERDEEKNKKLIREQFNDTIIIKLKDMSIEEIIELKNKLNLN